MLYKIKSRYYENLQHKFSQLSRELFLCEDARNENVEIEYETQEIKHTNSNNIQKCCINLYTGARTASVRRYMLKPDRCWPSLGVKVNEYLKKQIITKNHALCMY